MPRYSSTQERVQAFWKNVTPQASGCFLWCGATDRDGYGTFRFGSSKGAHRVAYEMYYGPIKGRLQVDHLCRNRACVNALHMELVTTQENTARGVAARTTSRCGHPKDTAYFQGGKQYRRCGKCRREYLRDYNANRR